MRLERTDPDGDRLWVEPLRSEVRAGKSGIGALQWVADHAADGRRWPKAAARLRRLDRRPLPLSRAGVGALDGGKTVVRRLAAVDA